MTDWPAQGTLIRFKNGGEILEGVVNGDPFRHESITSEDSELGIYIPVHVTEKNWNIVVDSRNVIESA